MRIITKIIALVFLLMTLNGCKSLKDGLQGNKKSKNAKYINILLFTQPIHQPVLFYFTHPKCYIHDIPVDLYCLTELQKIYNKNGKD